MSTSLLSTFKNLDDINDFATIANGVNQLVVSSDPNSPLDPSLNNTIAALSVSGAIVARRARKTKDLLVLLWLLINL